MARCLNLEMVTCGLFVAVVLTHTLNVWPTTDDSVEQGDIYDLKFRTERLIIHSTNPVRTGYHHWPDQKWIPFGPIFHLELLNQALDLQNEIADMRVPFNSSYITLKDICYQPQLLPQANQDCKIESIFQYFQNNKTKLNKCLTSLGLNCSKAQEYDFKAYDFHDHLLWCTKYPGSQKDDRLLEPCIATFGGAIDPNFVLDGFNGTEYKNATTLIINFVVIDYEDESKLAKVKVWENAFEEFMNAYVNKSSNKNLTISYSSNPETYA